MEVGLNILIIDNYDSFTYNLYQQIARVGGCQPRVVANDQISFDEIKAMQPDLIVISPGPGRPDIPSDFGVCAQVLNQDVIPVFGVCLGFQGMVWCGGGQVIQAPQVMHGRTSPIFHNEQSLFEGLPQGFEVVRYHSLVVKTPLPDHFEALAWTRDGLIMAAAHRHRPQWGIQFHPESISTQFGDAMIANALRKAGLRIPPELPPRYQIAQSQHLLTRHFKERTTWVEPERVYLELFAQSPRHFWLDSSLHRPGFSRFSFMGDTSGPGSYSLLYQNGRLVRHQGDDHSVQEDSFFTYLNEILGERTHHHPNLPLPFQGGLVGYMGYELKRECGASSRFKSPHPDAAFIYSTRFIAFDHQKQRIFLVALTQDKDDAEAWFASTCQRLDHLQESPPLPLSPPQVKFDWTQERQTYLDHVATSLEEIHAGNTYEVCLTNRIKGTATEDPVTLYRRLRKNNPAPYAACLRFDDLWILSSSPEQFLRIDPGGRVSSKPIKGTRARQQDPESDRLVARELAGAVKDRSENLMIVDLLRNDLGKVCQIGSVHVPKLMEVETYATVHQLVSTVAGRLHPDYSVVDCLQATFPGGSMTGAPKLRTMEIIDHLETDARGIYSGCIGYLGLDGGSELSIVIRTAVIENQKVSIGTGGAIVALSDPEAEFEETITKAQAILQAINATL